MMEAVSQSEFWAGKRVFVTGHTGFKGSWLSIWLASLGAKVFGYALAPTQTPAMFDVADVQGALVQHEVGDIRDAAHLSKAVEKASPDVVFHLAAQSLVYRGYEEPADTFDVNVIGTARVLDACRRLPAGTPIVAISSDKCYENKDDGRDYVETDPMGGKDPYSASKGAMELLLSAYRSSFFDTPDRPRLASGRAGNVIGGGDWSPHRLLPDCAASFSQGRHVFVRHPKATRPWQHVLEPLQGYLVLAQTLASDTAAAGGWNFGPESAAPVRVVIEHAIRAWGDEAGFEYDPEYKQEWREAKTLGLDCSRAGSLLHWRPRLSLQESVALTMAWYKKAYSGAGPHEMQRLTLDQIRAYSNGAGAMGETA